MLAESIPAGTTTALLVLRSLGYDAMVSSGVNINPVELKDKIWNEASARAGIKFGGLKDDPLRAIREMGDPMQSAVLGFIIGSCNETEIILAGGTQMLAVAACAKALGVARKMTVATTKYVANDSSSAFNELAQKLGVETFIAPLNFSASPYNGLKDYEKGYVKEGVGAGGSVLYASWNGIDAGGVIARTNSLYQEILKQKAD
jgi:NaMN:DMB phosphoribosyltransferase